MPGERVTIGHLFVIRWDTVVEEDLAPLLREVRAVRDRTGRPVIYAAIQDNDYREPSARVKQSFKHLLPELMKYIKMDYLVILATGIQASLQRTILKAMFTSGRIAGMPYLNRIVILDSFEELLHREAADLPAPASEIVQELRVKRLLRTSEQP
jgi:predicted AlkP superfamily pyrophosphatase or phosphodiesterase